MIDIESVWIGEQLLEISKGIITPSLLNVGSSTKDFREKSQPHIQKNIFDRLAEANVKVTHLDIKEDVGVDIVGDLTDPQFLKSLQAQQYNIVLSSNLLEHVINPKEICSSMENCVPLGGYIVVTVPHVYPYHEDPIDTLYRPSPVELKEMFQNSEMIKEFILEINDTYFKSLVRNKKDLFLFIVRFFTPFYKFKKWQNFVFKGFPYLFKNFKVSCLIVRKVHTN